MMKTYWYHWIRIEERGLVFFFKSIQQNRVKDNLTTRSIEL